MRGHGNRQTWCRPGPDSSTTGWSQLQQAALPVSQPMPNTILLNEAQTGFEDSVGQLCSVSSRHLASVAWLRCTAGPAGPRALSASATAQQGWGFQAVMGTPCQSPSATPPGPEASQALQSSPGVSKQSGQSFGGSEQWPQEAGPAGNEPLALSSAAKSIHGPPRPLMASLFRASSSEL